MTSEGFFRGVFEYGGHSMIAHNLVLMAILALGAEADDSKKYATPGNPPDVLIASQIDKDENLLLVEYRTIFIQPAGPSQPGGPMYNDRSTYRVPLKGVVIYGGDGKEISVAVARKQLGDKDKDAAIVVTSWGHQLSPVYRKLFKQDVLVFAFPKEAPGWKPIQAPDLPIRK